MRTGQTTNSHGLLVFLKSGLSQLSHLCHPLCCCLLLQCEEKFDNSRALQKHVQMHVRAFDEEGERTSALS